MDEVVCVSSAQAGVATSDAPPIHYTVKIQLFSLLEVEKYESGVFEAGGYKWKLVLYPKGNKSKNVTEHLSLYLAMADTNSLRLGWEVHAVFRLFLLSQHRDNYLMIPEKECRYYGLRLEWGLDQFIPLATFKDPRNGYLVEDSCVFGAEVFVRRESRTGKGECLSMIKAFTTKNIWRIDNFSKSDSEFKESKTFFAGEQRWKIMLYPKGKGLGSGTYLSLYLGLADLTTISPGSKVLAEFTLRIFDLSGRGSHVYSKVKYWFSASSSEAGWSRFISLDQFEQPSNGYLVKDICLVEAEVAVLGITNVF